MKVWLAKTANRLMIAILVVNALALMLFIGSIGVGYFPSIMQKSPLMFQDFVKYYACGKVALSAERQDAYELSVQLQTLHAILDPYIKQELPKQYDFPTDYPPPVYAVMAPVALLPLDIALFLFLLVSIASACTGVFLVTGKDVRKTVLWMLGISASVLSWRTLAMGQMTWLVMGVMAMFFYFFLKKRDIISGITLAVIALKLQYAIFFLVPVFACRRWNVLRAALVPIIALCAITAFTLGPDFIQTYPQVISRIEGTDPYIRSMMCIRAMGTIFCPPSVMPFLTGFSMIAGVGACTAAWRFASKRSLECQRWAAAVTICVALIASPHTHSYDSLLLAVAAMLTLPTLDPFKLFTNQPLPMNIWSGALITFPLTSWFLFKLPADQIIVQSAAFFLIALVLAIAAAINLVRTSQLPLRYEPNEQGSGTCRS